LHAFLPRRSSDLCWAARSSTRPGASPETSGGASSSSGTRTWWRRYPSRLWPPRTWIPPTTSPVSRSGWRGTRPGPAAASRPQREPPGLLAALQGGPVPAVPLRVAVVQPQVLPAADVRMRIPRPRALGRGVGANVVIDRRGGEVAPHPLPVGVEREDLLPDCPP